MARPNPFDRWHGFECGIIGPSELENLCIEILYGDEIVAWILDERDRREVRLEGRSNGDPWVFDLDDFLAYAQHANHCLTEYDGTSLVIKALEVSSIPDATDRIAEIEEMRATRAVSDSETTLCVVCNDLDVERQTDDND